MDKIPIKRQKLHINEIAKKRHYYKLSYLHTDLPVVVIGLAAGVSLLCLMVAIMIVVNCRIFVRQKIAVQRQNIGIFQTHCYSNYFNCKFLITIGDFVSATKGYMYSHFLL